MLGHNVILSRPCKPDTPVSQAGWWRDVSRNTGLMHLFLKMMTFIRAEDLFTCFLMMLIKINLFLVYRFISVGFLLIIRYFFLSIEMGQIFCQCADSLKRGWADSGGQSLPTHPQATKPSVHTLTDTQSHRRAVIFHPAQWACDRSGRGSASAYGRLAGLTPPYSNVNYGHLL